MISRTISRNPTLATFSQRYKDPLGKKLRDCIARIGHYAKPLKKYVFRNFIIVHYTYIITMTILVSIILYPIRNERYIDVLFLAAGTTTQGGLNTVNINSLKLYQQIVIYVSTFLTAPIAIHSTLAFVRLYWFERHFDGIRDSSKRNFKMRRTMTILGRELSARTMSRHHQRTVPRQFTSASRRNNDDFQEKLFSGKMLHRDEQDSLPDSQAARSRNSISFADPNSLSRTSSPKVERDKDYQPSGRGLLFKETKPMRNRRHLQPYEGFASRRSREISPEDMYRSITMMQDHHQPNAENEGPPLIIGAPVERSDGITVSAAGSGRSRVNKKDWIRSNANEKYPRIPPSGSPEEKEYRDDRGEGGINGESSPVSWASDSTSLRSGPVSGSDEQSDPFAEFRRNSSGTFSSSGRSEMSSNALASDDRETVRRAATRTSEQSPKHLETLGPGANGPSIRFDVAAFPRERAERSRVRKNRASISDPAIISPKSKSLGQKLKRRLSFVSDTSRLRGKRSDPNRLFEDEDRRNTIENMDDYFADDESDTDDGRDGGQKHMSRSNTFDQSRSQVQEYLDVLGKSKSYDLGQTKEWNKLSASPEFQNMIYKNWKKNRRRKSRLIPRRKPEGMGPRVGSEKFYSDPESDNGGEDISQSSLRRANTVPDDEDASSYQDNSVNTGNTVDEEEGYFGPGSFGFGNDGSRLLSRTNTNYLSWQPTVGRNSTFIGMNKEQKEELGGVEYRSIKLLCRILVAYYGGFWILAFLFLVPWMVTRNGYKKIVKSDGEGPAWWGFFTGMSAFSNLGFTLTPDSMESFQTTSYPTIIMMWFIVIGNTGFPVLLRFILWIMFQLAPDLSLTKEGLGFLLDHPRRCFTMLFPSGATWWLVLTLVAMNAIDLIIFVILDFGSSSIHYLNHGYRVLVGLFQAISTRTAGFQIVDLGSLHPAVQVYYMLMMYVSVMPMAISIRRTNVYEEQSLGIYGQEEEENREESLPVSDAGNDTETSRSAAPPKNKKKKEKNKKHHSPSFIGAHLMLQLSYDLWFMFLSLFIICLVESGKIQDIERPTFNIFTILFEIVSAYGTVGLSLGYPNTETSFSAQFNTLSKLIVIALMIRGRHRGLPYSLDRAIILPSNRLDKIDRLQDVKWRKRIGEQRRGDNDPVTAYFKSKLSAIKRGFREMRTSAAAPTEHLLHEFNEHTHESHHDDLGENGEYESQEVHEANRALQAQEDSKEDSSPQESSSQPQGEPHSYVPQEHPSSSGCASYQRQTSDPLSYVPYQYKGSAPATRSPRNFPIRRTNST